MGVASQLSCLFHVSGHAECLSDVPMVYMVWKSCRAAQLSWWSCSHAHTHSRVTAVSVRGEVAACPLFARLKGSCNPALLLPALLGRGPALSVNKLFIYFPHSSFNFFFFFPLLLSTCVQSMCSKNKCSSKVPPLWKPGIQVCITLQCSENALGSPRWDHDLFCSILQNVSAMVETVLFYYYFFFLISTILTAVRIHCWFCDDFVISII